MLLYIVLGLIFLTGSLSAYYILSHVSKRIDPVHKRLRNVESLAGNVDLKSELLAKKGLKKKLDPKIDQLVTTLTNLTKKNEQYDSKLRVSLMQAGYYQENSVRLFKSLRIIVAMVIFLLFGFLGYLGGKGPSVIFLSLLMSLMGYNILNFLLKSKIRRRQDEIARGLPDALDFLVICVEAGLGLNAALVRVGQELQLRCKALGEELLMVNQEMRTGVTRENAIRNLGDRNTIKDLQALSGAIILSDRLGTNIAHTLRAQSDSLRTRVRQRAEEKAAKAGLKMLFPLVFLIMPSLFIVILGPGIIMVMKQLFPIME